VNGKQYIAVVAANGGNHARLFMRMMPEIKNPANRSASVWVFEVPDTQAGRARAPAFYTGGSACESRRPRHIASGPIVSSSSLPHRTWP